MLRDPTFFFSLLKKGFHLKTDKISPNINVIPTTIPIPISMKKTNLKTVIKDESLAFQSVDENLQTLSHLIYSRD